MDTQESAVQSQYQQSSELIDTEEPPLISSKRSQEFLKHHYPKVSIEEWNDWKWQIRNSITSINDLKRTFGIFNIAGIVLDEINLPIRITPYYASLITKLDKGIGKCVIPNSKELIVTDSEENDSLHEGEHNPVPNIVHRYPDRVLFLTTDFCSSYCRYCTRSHMVAKHDINKKIWDQGIQYIKDHEEIRDVLLSGGDILTMSDENIEYLLSEIRKIEHVEFLRIGTKVPVVLPQRVTQKLVDMLKKYHPLFMSIHFSHPDELTPEVKEACERLANAGIPLGSQTVLLKDVNDDVETMKKLVHGLLKIRVRPYYLYQADKVVGTSHFRTTVSKGLEIIESLRGWTSGYAVPQFVIDAPGGGGKIPLLPEYYKGREGNCVKLRNYEGKEFIYCED
jgi:lysine 2,3-aminomutase